MMMDMTMKRNAKHTILRNGELVAEGLDICDVKKWIQNHDKTNPMRPKAIYTVRRPGFERSYVVYAGKCRAYRAPLT
jgi:hypothetical protein